LGILLNLNKTKKRKADMPIKPRSVSLPEEMWHWLARKAKEDDRSVSAILRQHIRAAQALEDQESKSAPLPSRGGNAAHGAQSGMRDCPAMNKLKKPSSRAS